MLDSRYPGVVSFTTAQKNIFFGRETDATNLYNLIRNRKQVLLYSKSGIGKSSLLNAGLIPKLTDDYIVLPIRFFLYNDLSPINPVERVKQIIANKIQNTKTKLIDTILEKSNTPKTLWYYYKKLQTIDNKKIVLIFDQFEELFSYPEEMRNDFKQQLYELTSVDIPINIFSYLVKNQKLEWIEQNDCLQNDLNIRCVFAVRFDYLSQINELSNFFPDIQQNYYELKPLSANLVRDAIVKPAMQVGKKFASPAFSIEEEAIAYIIETLTTNFKKDIETTQLQLICREIEIIALQKYIKGGKNIVVLKNEIPEFSNIFLTFYESSVNKLEKSNQIKARKFIEDVLIRNGLRVSFDKLVCTDYLKEQDIDTLINCHLLRKEPNSTGGESIELCHDTLIEPILKIANLRKQEEQIYKIRQKQEQEQKEQEEKDRKIKLEQNRIKKRKALIRTTIFSIILATVFLLLSLFSFKMWLESEEKNKQIVQAYLSLSKVIKLERDGSTKILPLEKQIQKIDKNTDSLDKQIQIVIENHKKIDSLFKLIPNKNSKIDTLLNNQIDELHIIKSNELLDNSVINNKIAKTLLITLLKNSQDIWLPFKLFFKNIELDIVLFWKNITLKINTFWKSINSNIDSIAKSISSNLDSILKNIDIIWKPLSHHLDKVFLFLAMAGAAIVKVIISWIKD